LPVGESGTAKAAGGPQDIVRIAVRRIDRDLPVPAYARAGDAGLDLFAAEDVTLPPGHRAQVRTGLAVAIPEGYAGFVIPRSGRAARDGLSIVNAPGLIDSGYRGEIKINAINHDSSAPVEIKRGDRIAQLVIVKVEHAELQVVDELPPSERGEGGHGSTGR
jgi:dUTP pyrophosphatase